MNALEHAYVDSTRDVGLVAAAFVLVGLLASLSLGTKGPAQARQLDAL